MTKTKQANYTRDFRSTQESKNFVNKEDFKTILP